MTENPKALVGRAKVRQHFVPPIARLVEGIVMELGAKKYGPFNWRKDPIRATDYIDAIRRHLDAWEDGQDLDEESAVSHLGHIRACCAILLDAEAIGNLIDDREKGFVIADLLHRGSGKAK